MTIQNLFVVTISFAIIAVFSNDLSAQNPLILGVYNKKVSPEKTICAQVYGREFKQILSMQYTLKWDTELLEFKSIQGFGLPNLNEQNFGKKQTDEGLLTFAWFDPQLQGISKADGAVLYEVCFEVIGKAGQQTYIEFVNEPTLIEVSAAPGTLINMKTEGSKLEIR